MSSPFQRAFSSRSPLNKHKKIQKKINMLRNNPAKAERKGLSAEGQGGIDYEAIAKLESQLAEAKKAHTTQRTEEGDEQVRADEDAAQGSAAEMRSPLKKNSPLKGSYESPAGAPYVSQTSYIQQAVGDVQNAINTMMNESDANKAKRLQGRVNRRMNRLDHEGGTLKYTDDKGNLVELDESKFYDDVNTATDAEKEAYAKAKANAQYYDKDDVHMEHMDKTIDLQSRATAHGDAAAATATAAKDKEIEELKKKIELLKEK